MDSRVAALKHKTKDELPDEPSDVYVAYQSISRTSLATASYTNIYNYRQNVFTSLDGTKLNLELRKKLEEEEKKKEAEKRDAAAITAINQSGVPNRKY